jgi:hypothetical protein
MPKELGKLIAKVWEDEQLKGKFKNDPKAVLAEYGIEVPAHKEIEVLESTDETTYLVLPPPEKESKVVPLEKLPEPYGLDAVTRVVITKAQKDAAFRKLALTDPLAAMAQIGITISTDHVVKIVEATLNKGYVIIPRAPKGKLSLGELDKVAGGGSSKVLVTTDVVVYTFEAEVTSTTTTAVEVAETASTTLLAAEIVIVAT